jgi:hypothetical protein
MEIKDIIYQFLLWSSNSSECDFWIDEFLGKEKQLIDKFLNEKKNDRD